MNMEIKRRVAAVKTEGKIDFRTESGFSGNLSVRQKEKRKEIKASMKRWQAHNKYGRSLGRGLNSDELLDKVAGETGATKTHIRFSLKQKD